MMNKESRACDSKPSASWEATQALCFTYIFEKKKKKKKESFRLFLIVV
jgi:hypothetical protein